MRLDELRWEIIDFGQAWQQATNTEGFEVYRALKSECTSGHEHTYSVGDYAIIVPKLEDPNRRIYHSLTPIAAQAVLFHLTQTSNDDTTKMENGNGKTT